MENSCVITHDVSIIDILFCFIVCLLMKQSLSALIIDSYNQLKVNVEAFNVVYLQRKPVKLTFELAGGGSP